MRRSSSVPTAAPNVPLPQYRASSGFVKYEAYCKSLYGVVAFHLSFMPMGITASFVSGMPRRDTCTKSADTVGFEPSELSVVIFGRDADAQTPMTKSGSRIFAADETPL